MKTQGFLLKKTWPIKIDKESSGAKKIYEKDKKRKVCGFWGYDGVWTC